MRLNNLCLVSSGWNNLCRWRDNSSGGINRIDAHIWIGPRESGDQRPVLRFGPRLEEAPVKSVGKTYQGVNIRYEYKHGALSHYHIIVYPYKRKTLRLNDY